MNAKIERIGREIDKTKGKISEWQAKLRDLEKQKTELENADIVATVRSISIPPAELEAFARAFMEQRKSVPIPDLAAIQAGYAEENQKEDLDVEG